MPTTLERTIPDHQFRERHSRWIDASSSRVWEALTGLTWDQLTVARPLMTVRRLGRTPPSPSRLLFDEGPVTMLEVAAPTYALGGAIARPWQRKPAKRPNITTVADFAAFDEPGWVKYVIDFLLEPEGAGTRLSTETRGYSTDDRARRRFRIYWALIRPASGLVRRDMLAATARAAERPPTKGTGA